MIKEEQLDELVEYIVEAMDVSDLEAYTRQTLREYYASPEGADDFDTNYSEMKNIVGNEEEE
tara:strand:- start:890 stop:1075 length:186 start_codon:yes stop_codon:yes gene_type:complete